MPWSLATTLIWESECLNKRQRWFFIDGDWRMLLRLNAFCNASFWCTSTVCVTRRCGRRAGCEVSVFSTSAHTMASLCLLCPQLLSPLWPKRVAACPCQSVCLLMVGWRTTSLTLWGLFYYVVNESTVDVTECIFWETGRFGKREEDWKNVAGRTQTMKLMDATLLLISVLNHSV